MPLASPWVRLASQKPPLRPLAPNATVCGLEDHDPQAGSVSVRASAVHSPVNPAPTIATSTSSRSPGSSGGSAVPSGAGSRNQ